MSVGLATFGMISSGGAGVRYRMRGYDTSLGQYVYWFSSEIDSDGSDYVDPPSLTDIVVFAQLPPTS